MKTVQLSEFQDNCQFFLREVEQNGEIIVLIKNGLPVSQIQPYFEKQNSLFGIHKGKLSIQGDILSAIEIDWEKKT